MSETARPRERAWERLLEIEKRRLSWDAEEEEQSVLAGWVLATTGWVEVLQQTQQMQQTRRLPC